MPKGTKENIKKKNTVRKTKIKGKNIEETKDDKFSFDEEIVIGLKRLDEPEIISRKGNKKKTNNINNGRNRISSSKNDNSRNYRKGNVRNNRQSNKKSNNDGIIDIGDEDNVIIQSKYMQNYEDDLTSLKRRNNKIQQKANSSQGMQKANNRRVKNVQNKKDTKKNVQRNNRSNYEDRRFKTININAPLSKEEIQKIEKSKKKRKLILKIIKWLTLLAIIIGGTIYAMLSPIFNIKEVEVIGNSKISSETIISLSGITIDQNMFSFRTSNVRESIKNNAYIDTVEIHRDLPDKISLVVTERKTTYMIKFGNAYAYINNQGYILEITDKEEAVPIITGYETLDENIQEGNRLNTEDLEKLNDVLKIMEAASSSGNNLKNLITKIDISDKSNYILDLKTQKKQIYFGDATNLSTKMLWIDQILGEEKKSEGILYLNMDLNTDRPYFREKI